MPTKQRRSVWFTDDEWEALKDEANRLGVTITELVRQGSRARVQWERARRAGRESKEAAEFFRDWR